MSVSLPVLIIILQLIFLEGILSIDNAAVLGAMVVSLPDDQNIPWPKPIVRLGRRLNRLLGKQRIAALRVGLLGAYLGRGMMLFLASFLIHNPWVRLVGAAYLIRLALNELGDTTPEVETEAEKQKALQASSFWFVVLTVELMDLVFSIDNVIAAVSLSNQLWVVLVGVGIGILTMRFAAGLFSYAVEREPILKKAAYILILNIGIQLIIEQVWQVHFSDIVRFLISAAIILGALAYAHIHPLRKLHFIFVWFSVAMGALNQVVDICLYPFKWVFQLLFSGRRRSSSTEPL